ncbi:MBL fold metallo-hydrolase [Azotosporobacter soli]|uniref:MBL fold metallo-hydrolase n=1 Tax=Azotosporobacter soli TaxID=3055040 RepID=UPI0031FF0DDE
MQVHVLASGSTGNCIVLDFAHTRLLVDAGISTRRIKNGLAEIGLQPEELDGVFLTHEHRDHVNGLATLTKKYRLPVYATAATWQNMFCRAAIPDECCRILSENVGIGAVNVRPFAISHDAAAPVGYSFYTKELKCTVATDLGFVTDGVREALDYSDILVLESNHDVEMLQQGSYPWHLKRRILSNRGHLSNVDAGWAIARMAKKDKLQVLLAHLSQENNCQELAERTVANIVSEQGFCLENQIKLHMTQPDQRVSIAL